MPVIAILRSSRSQEGIVLIVVLVTLVVMSLGVIALIRAVQNSNTGAGNLAFRQATTQAGEIGVEAAVNALLGIATSLDADSVAQGYFASVANLAGSAVPDTLRWADQPCYALDGRSTDCVLDGTYRLQRIVERLCSRAPVTDPLAQCVGGDPLDSGSKKSNAPVMENLSSILYRISVRTRGPRNTESLVQMVVAL